MRKMYYMSFNVGVYDKSYSCTLPRRFEKREWLDIYGNYLIGLANDILYRANGVFVDSDNYEQYINKEALKHLSIEELDFVLMYYTKQFFMLVKYKGFSMNIGISSTEI